MSESIINQILCDACGNDITRIGSAYSKQDPEKVCVAECTHLYHRSCIQQKLQIAELANDQGEKYCHCLHEKCNSTITTSQVLRIYPTIKSVDMSKHMPSAITIEALTTQISKYKDQVEKLEKEKKDLTQQLKDALDQNDKLEEELITSDKKVLYLTTQFDKLKVQYNESEVALVNDPRWPFLDSAATYAAVAQKPVNSTTASINKPNLPLGENQLSSTIGHNSSTSSGHPSVPASITTQPGKPAITLKTTQAALQQAGKTLAHSIAPSGAKKSEFTIPKAATNEQRQQGDEKTRVVGVSPLSTTDTAASDEKSQSYANLFNDYWKQSTGQQRNQVLVEKNSKTDGMSTFITAGSNPVKSGPLSASLVSKTSQTRRNPNPSKEAGKFTMDDTQEGLPALKRKRHPCAEQSKNHRRFNFRYDTDSNNLRPFHPINIYPHLYTAAARKVDGAYVTAIFASDIFIFGDAHACAIAEFVICEKSKFTKLDRNFYRRNMSITDLIMTLFEMDQFPRRVLMSIGNYDIHLDTDFTPFNSQMQTVTREFQRLGVREVMILPPVQSLHLNHTAYRNVMLAFDFDWGRVGNFEYRVAGDLLLNLPATPKHDKYGPYFDYKDYDETVEHICAKLIPPAKIPVKSDEVAATND